MSAKTPWSHCSGSVTGHDCGGTTDGTCTWCGRQIDAPPPKPRAQSFEPTELREAYDYHHDPDYGALSESEIRTRYQTGRES